MAKAETPVAPAPPPPPPVPQKSVVETARESVAHAKTGPDALRPVRYTASFIKGTLVDGLDGLAHFGRHGLFAGLALGAIAGIAASSILPMVVGGALIGLAIGGGGGAAWGLATGGMKAVGRIHRGEKYAEDLIVRKQVRDHAPVNRNDFTKAYNDQRAKDAAFNQQAIARYNEDTRDFHRYWQDHEDQRRQQHDASFAGPRY